jgi:predicted methyltransferase
MWMRPLLTAGVIAMVAGTALVAQAPRPHGRLFPPQDLGLLEAPDRDRWQRPDRIMDALGIADASRVADVGAGSGWFTIRLARRVGPQGVVYAEDVQQEMLNAISRRVQREGLANVRPVLGRGADPRLPEGSLDAVIIVDAYHEIEDRVMLLTNVARALKPQGRIGVIDFRVEGGGPGPDSDERVPPDMVVADANRAGLQVVGNESFLPYQYFLIFAKEEDRHAARTAERAGAPR